MRNPAPISLALSLFVVALLLTFSVQLILPIYCDEYAYQLIDARALFDHFTYSSYIPLCTDARNIPMPWSWYPAQALWGALYYEVESPRVFRLIGVVIYLLGIIGLAELAWRATDRRISRAALYAILLAFISIGTLPLICVFNRPEFVLLVGFGWFSFAPLLIRQWKTWNWTLVLFLCVHVFAVGLFFSIHPKSVLFCPLVIGSSVLLVRRWGLTASIAALILTGTVFAQSYSVYSRSSACQSSVAAAKINPSMYVVINRHTFSTLGTTFKQLGKNLAHSDDYVSHNLFCTTYRSDWLPPQKDVRFIERVTNLLIKIVTFSVVFFGLSLVGISLQRLATNQTSMDTVERLGIPLVGFFCLLGLDAVQTAKHFYESVLILPAFGLIVLCLWRTLEHVPWVRYAGYRLFVAVLAVSTLSQFVLWNRVAFPLWHGYSGRGQGVITYDKDKVTRQLAKALALSGLQNGSTQQHVMVDDQAYMYLKKTFEPINSSYFDWSESLEHGRSWLDTDHYYEDMKRIGVTGVVENCNYMDILPVLGRRSVRVGNMCAIGENDIDRLAAASSSLSQ